MRPHLHSERPALITTAPENPDEEYQHRRKRYAIMMAIRALCVVAAALTYRFSIVMALLFLVGGAVIPWCAVILANDRPPLRRLKPPGQVDNVERQLPGRTGRTIDE